MINPIPHPPAQLGGEELEKTESAVKPRKQEDGGRKGGVLMSDFISHYSAVIRLVITLSLVPQMKCALPVMVTGE